MSLRLSNKLLWVANATYRTGVVTGVFHFRFNTSTNKFELSRSCKIYGRIYAIALILYLGSCLPFIIVATIALGRVLSSYTEILTLIMQYIMLVGMYWSIRNQESLVDVLNNTLALTQLIYKQSGQTTIKFRSKNMKIVVKMCVVEFIAAISFMTAIISFQDGADLRFFLVIFFMYFSIIGKFLANCYSIVMLYILQLIEKQDDSIKLTLKEIKSNNLKKLSPFEWMELSCMLSDQIDNYSVIFRKIQEVINNLGKYLWLHLLLIITYKFIFIVLESFIGLNMMVFNFANLSSKQLFGCMVMYVMIGTDIYHVYTINFVTQMVQDGVRYLLFILKENYSSNLLYNFRYRRLL